MALKRKISKSDYTALNALLQAEYKLEGEEYILDAEGFDDPAELKRALDREREEKKAAAKKATDAETELRTLKEGTARSSGDIATLEKSWKDKEAIREKEHKAELEKRDKHLQATLVDSVATQLASELGGENAALLIPHIKGRLTADLTGDTPLTRVLDKDGKPSAFSVEDLRKEISSDTRFKSVIVVGKGSGGGAAGAGRPNNGGAGAGQKKFGELNDAERTQWYKDDPNAFNAAAAAHRAEVADRPAVRRAF